MGQLPHGRYTYYGAIFGCIRDYNRTGSNSRSFAYTHTRADYRAGPNRYIVLDDRWIGGIMNVINSRVFVVTKRCVRPNKHTVPNLATPSNEGPVLYAHIVTHDGSFTNPCTGANHAPCTRSHMRLDGSKLPHRRIRTNVTPWVNAARLIAKHHSFHSPKPLSLYLSPSAWYSSWRNSNGLGILNGGS